MRKCQPEVIFNVYWVKGYFLWIFKNFFFSLSCQTPSKILHKTIKQHQRVQILLQTPPENNSNPGSLKKAHISHVEKIWTSIYNIKSSLLLLVLEEFVQLFRFFLQQKIPSKKKRKIIIHGHCRTVIDKMEKTLIFWDRLKYSSLNLSFPVNRMLCFQPQTLPILFHKSYLIQFH